MFGSPHKKAHTVSKYSYSSNCLKNDNIRIRQTTLDPDKTTHLGNLMKMNCVYKLSHAMRNQIFAYAKTKAQISFAAISTFVFATLIVQSLFFLNPKFQAFSLLDCTDRFVSDLYAVYGNPKDWFSRVMAQINYCSVP